MVRKIYIIIISACLLVPVYMQAQSVAEMVDECASQAGDDATYLRDFQVVLGAAQEGQRPPVLRFPLVLSKNNIYRFSVCNTESSTGKAVLKLYDSNRMIFSSYVDDTKEEYNPFNFMCQKTGIYHVFISFHEGEPGEAVGILSYVTKK
jgi:hypothetical protein